MPFDRHTKIAFQFSGGKDSLAALYLLEAEWGRMTVYWLNSGDAFPETLDIVAMVRAAVPHFVEVPGHVEQVIEEFGLPSDITTANSTPLGQVIEPGTMKLQDRYSCCARTVMNPLHNEMMKDGVTLIIRGQKQADHSKGPVRSGEVIDGVEYFYPIEDWTTAHVFEFLAVKGLPINRVYDTMSTTPECMSCSAWWDDKRGAYLKQFHPEQYAKYQSRLEQIRVVVMPVISAFNVEVQ